MNKEDKLFFIIPQNVLKVHIVIYECYLVNCNTMCNMRNILKIIILKDHHHKEIDEKCIGCRDYCYDESKNAVRRSFESTKENYNK